ncbi:alkyldihydroxyacetonephosphate synthase [Caloramator quimbayensis]|uniref:Alkyldihydroxyacetonephosphate synthase n=1 Tax=Caloramator quimbayensis TaxID=1147123 RepID=A0A1T4Y707_9CLOT|nr:FAD-binding oxidoreductase [Caloramator quimbayensis]SKA97045.1 alkyldihydroxyacetonephosphate synthase [Caloramator quimbayensis]
MKNDFIPDWFHEAPPEGSYRSILKWGDPNEFKHPNKKLYELMKNVFNMTDEDFTKKQKMGLEKVSYDKKINLTPNQIEKLTKIVGEENVRLDEYSRLQVAYGKTMIDLMRLREGIVENVPDIVIHPRSKEDIREIVKYCNNERIPVYVYGGGSSVTRGVECVKGGVSLDMRVHMKRVLKFNEINQTITVEPGMSGPDLEKTLNNAQKLFGAKRAYTCGHFPQSFEYSSVGGWVVTRGAGQNSTYFGKIEDMVICQEYVTPVGDIVTDEYPAVATGPSIDEIMMGSEGAFGILVSVTLKIFRYMPENQRRFSYIFKNWEDAKNAAREIMQGQFGYPSVFRLSDPEETDVVMKLYGVEGTIIDKIMTLRGYKPMERCLLLGFTDGEALFTKVVKKNIHKICKNYGAMYTTGYVTKGWEKGRFKDPYMREDLQDFGIMTDTLECAVSYDNMQYVYEGVRNFCKSRPNTVCMTHISHFYPQGANLYFIFIAKINEIQEYLDYQYGILDNIQKYGAAMSHHHGIGKMTAPWLEGQIGKNQMEVFKVLKRHFDPNNIMNPGGTLGLDIDEDKKRFLKK